MRRWTLVAVLVATLAATSCSGGNSLGGGAPGPAPGGNANAAALPTLSVHQPEVPVEFQVVLYPNGDRVQGEVTLDLCAATYPSEALRIARRQTAVVDGQQRLVFSTEAVGYQNAAATVQAFSELRDAQAKCPADFVPSAAAGGLALRTIFNPAPDKNWSPAPAGIDRLVFDMLVVDEEGRAARTAAIYLRRGRILLGLYYYLLPDQPLPSVEGQTTVEAITGLFATRLSQLSAKVAGG